MKKQCVLCAVDTECFIYSYIDEHVACVKPNIFLSTYLQGLGQIPRLKWLIIHCSCELPRFCLLVGLCNKFALGSSVLSTCLYFS
jgi:hypothetical protein